MKKSVIIIATLTLANLSYGQHMNQDAFNFDASPKKIEIPITIEDREILAAGEVNGKKGLFYWDTGAPTLIINSEAFISNESTSAHTGDKKLGGATGTISNVSRFQMENFKLSEFSLSNVNTLGMPLGHLKDGNLGLIGTKMMKGYFTEFDLKSQKIIMTKLNNSSVESDVLELYKKIDAQWGSHLPVVTIEINGQKLNMVLDSGCSTMMIDPKYKETLAGSFKFNKMDTLRGGGKEEKMIEKFVFNEINFSGKTYHNVLGMFEIGIDRNFGPGNIDGIIGWDIFYHSIIAYNFDQKEIYIREN